MALKLKVEGHEGYAYGSMIEAFVHELEGVVNIVWLKTQRYGDTWRKQGWMGNLARILSKSGRLENMQWQDFGVEDANESVQDTAQDLVALAVFFLMNKGQQNKWGRVRGE
jgi:hypothetical protein